MKILDKIKDFFRKALGVNSTESLLPATTQQTAPENGHSRRSFLNKTNAITVDKVVSEIGELGDTEISIERKINELLDPVIDNIKMMNDFFIKKNLDTFVAQEPGSDPVKKLVDEIVDTILACYKEFYNDADLARNRDQYIAAIERLLEKEDEPQRIEELQKRLQELQALTPEKLDEMEHCDPMVEENETHVLDRIINLREKTKEGTLLGFPQYIEYSNYISDNHTHARWEELKPGEEVPYLSDLIKQLAPIALEKMKLERELLEVQGEKFGKMYSVISSTDRTCELPEELSTEFPNTDAYCRDYTDRGMSGLVKRITECGIKTENLRTIFVNALKNGGQALRSEESIRNVIAPLYDEELYKRCTGHATTFNFDTMRIVLSSIGKGMVESKLPQKHRILYYYDKESGRYKTVMGTEKNEPNPNMPQLEEKN